MVQLKRSQMRDIDAAFGMGTGYVLDFSNRTFEEFFEDEFGLYIYDPKYEGRGTSKANRLRAFIETEDAIAVSVVLRKLWEYRQRLPTTLDAEQEERIASAFFAVLTAIEGDQGFSRTDALERFRAADHTLEELVAAIERDILARRAAAALDRLHTYCMKKFAHLLQLRGEPCTREDPLHSRVGRYVKLIQAERDLREMSLLIAKSSISVFEKFNHVRNDRTFAHDNEIVDEAEARFIFEAVSSFLRFVKALDGDRFGR